MFTGIIREVGRVVALEGGVEDGAVLVVSAPESCSRVEVGGSVAIDGVCLTVEELRSGGQLRFHAVPETLTRTALSRLAAGDAVNVEPALQAGDPLGGHYVQGHVDGVGTVRAVVPEGEGRRLVVEAPAELLRYCVEKGSIAMEGVSLTVAELASDSFAVALIPHTLAETTLGEFETGREVNLEVDVLAKYVERLITRA